MKNLFSKLLKIGCHTWLSNFSKMPIDSCASMAVSKPKVVFILGPPGAGKGTQCRRIVDRYDFVHISAGELLRQERQNHSKYSNLIEKCITDGRIVPAHITCKLLENAIVGSPLKNRFLIDGYPRNFENRDVWDKSVGDKVSLLFVLYIECSPEVCKVRCLNRGASRSDDNDEVLQKRIKTHIKETQPIVDYYKRLNLVKMVNGDRDESSVFKDIECLFDSYQLNK